MNHKKLTILLAGGIVAVGLSGSAFAQEGKTTEAARLPRISVSETRFDFGRVTQGSSISHIFWLKNVGEDTLRITDVKPG